VAGDEACRIGTDPKERRMAERNDASITENEIEREREQAPDRCFSEDQVLVRQQPDGRKGRNPEGDFERTKAGARGQRAGDGGLKLLVHGATTYPGIAPPSRSEPADAPSNCGVI
jgi:hypothetical protein